MKDWERIDTGYKHKASGVFVGHHPAFSNLPDDQLNDMLNDVLADSRGEL